MIPISELRYVMALTRVPNLGAISIKKLLTKLGSAEAVFLEKKSSLEKIEGIRKDWLKKVNPKEHLEDADAEIRFMEENNIEHFYFKDSNYPEWLRHCIDAPIILFGKGNIDVKNRKMISIVGTRRATTAGLKFCEELIADLSPLQPVIVSGLAYGIDICAHKTALERGLQTIACLGHGMDRMYPKEHSRYEEGMMKNGGFLTEFWSTDPVDKTNFLRRNRIVAGMSEATIVIESAEKGGSLVTAEIANSYNREVFAVPGRPSDVQSRGCLNLIKKQKAHVLTMAADIVYHLGWELEKKQKPVQTQLFVELTDEEKQIFDFLKGKEKELLDHIALECKLPVFKVATVLMNMELKGVVRPLPGKLFALT